jgi:hypothetical protein
LIFLFIFYFYFTRTPFCDGKQPFEMKTRIRFPSGASSELFYASHIKLKRKKENADSGIRKRGA